MDSDAFSFNETFKHDRVRVKINTIQQQETAEEHKDTEEKVMMTT